MLYVPLSYTEDLARLEENRKFMCENEQEEWIFELCGHIHRGNKAPKTCLA